MGEGEKILLLRLNCCAISRRGDKKEGGEGGAEQNFHRKIAGGKK